MNKSRTAARQTNACTSFRATNKSLQPASTHLALSDLSTGSTRSTFLVASSDLIRSLHSVGLAVVLRGCLHDFTNTLPHSCAHTSRTILPQAVSHTKHTSLKLSVTPQDASSEPALRHVPGGVERYGRGVGSNVCWRFVRCLRMRTARANCFHPHKHVCHLLHVRRRRRLFQLR